MSSIIELKNIYKSFYTDDGELLVLENLSLTLEKGKILGINNLFVNDFVNALHKNTQNNTNSKKETVKSYNSQIILVISKLLYSTVTAKLHLHAIK